MGGDRALLALEQLDLRADALRAQRAALPERSALIERNAERQALTAARSEAAARLESLAPEEEAAERLAGELAAKVRELEAELYSGRTTASKELMGLQAELEAFRRRVAEQEDATLAWMGQQEEVAAEIAAADARLAAIAAEETRLRADLSAAESRIDAELETLEAQRAETAAAVAPAVRAAYDKLRASPRLAGQVTAPLAAGSCGRCRVTLPITVAGRVRPDADSAVQCPRCTRILLPAS